MAVPVIRVAPPNVRATDGGYSSAISGEVIGAGAASFLLYTSAIGGYIFQTAAAAHCAVGTTQNVTLTNDTVRGPDHASMVAMTVYPLQNTGFPWTMGVNGSGNRWNWGTSVDYKAGWRQGILDPTSTPEVGSARAIGQGTTNVFMAFNATQGGESMFEAYASACSWVGKHLEIDGGTSGDPITFAGVSAEDTVAGTRTTIAPFRGNYYGHVVDIGGGNIEMRGPIIIGHSNGTTVTYFKDLSLAIACNSFNRVNDKWYYIETQGNTTVFFGDSATPIPGTIAGTSTKKLRLDTATSEPAGGFQSWYRTWINGRSWTLGSNTQFHNGGLTSIDSVAMNAGTQILSCNIIQTRLDYTAPPIAGKLTGSIFSNPVDYCMTVSTQVATMNIDYEFDSSCRGAGKAINFTHTSGNIEIVAAAGYYQPVLADVTVSGAGTVSFPAGTPVTITAKAVTETGAPIQNALVLLKASDGTGPFPFDETVTIVNSGTTATVTHTAHGMASGDYVQITGANLENNNGVFQITVTGTNTYTYVMGSAPGSSPTGTIKATFVALFGLTDVNGDVTTSRIYQSAQPVTGWSRKSSSAPYYKQGILTGTVSITLGYSGTSVMVLDQ